MAEFSVPGYQRPIVLRWNKQYPSSPPIVSQQ
jgi:hypothetical protein